MDKITAAELIKKYGYDSVKKNVYWFGGNKRKKKQEKENDAVAQGIIDKVNQEEQEPVKLEEDRKRYTERPVEKPLVEEHPLGEVLIARGAGKMVKPLGAALAKGLDFVGRTAMPSTFLKGVAHYLPGIAEEVTAASPWADAAALSYWSAKLGNDALQAGKRGDTGSAVAYGALASMPALAHTLPRVASGLRSASTKGESPFYLGADAASVAPETIMDENLSDFNNLLAKMKHAYKLAAERDVVDLYTAYDGSYELSDNWAPTLNAFIKNNSGKALEKSFPGITKFAQGQLNQIKYNHLDVSEKKMYDFIKNSDKFKSLRADESDIFDLLKRGEDALEYEFPGLKNHMDKGLSQKELIEKYIKSHPSSNDWIYYSDKAAGKIDEKVFDEGLNEGLELNFPGITEYVTKNASEPKPASFRDVVKSFAEKGDEKGLVDYLSSEQVRNKTLTDAERAALSSAYNKLTSSFTDIGNTTENYPFFNTGDGHLVKKALQSTSPLGNYIKSAVAKNVDIRVKQSQRDAVTSILKKLVSGEIPPLELNAKDYFGKDIILPEEWVAALQLPEAKAAYPNGVDYFWRGNSAPIMYTGEFNTGYPSIFGGDFDLASGYNSQFAYSGGASPIPSTVRTQDPNMLLFAVPRGTILDLGKFDGAGWQYLPELTPEGRLMQSKINRIYSDKKANAWYPAVLDKLDDELYKATQWIQKNPFRFDSSLLRQYNPGIVPEGFIFDETKRFVNTDRLSEYIKTFAGSKEFPFQGVLLRGIHDGSLSGNPANEIIYNIEAGAGRVSPKLVSPTNPFTFDLTNGKPFASGGTLLHKFNEGGDTEENDYLYYNPDVSTLGQSYTVQPNAEPLYVDAPYTPDDFFRRWYPNRTLQMYGNMLTAAKTHGSIWGNIGKRKVMHDTSPFINSMLDNMDRVQEFTLLHPGNSDKESDFMFPSALRDSTARSILERSAAAKDRILGKEIPEHYSDSDLRWEGYGTYGFSRPADPFRIYYTTSKPSENTITHERTHPMQPMDEKLYRDYMLHGLWTSDSWNPMEWSIAKMPIDSETSEKMQKLDEKDRKYYYSSEEVNARLNALRENQNLNPKHKVTKEDLQEIKKNATHKDKEYFLDLFSDDMLLKLFNLVADAGTTEEKTNIAAEGGSIHIKPSHRGRLTELKARTGKTESELYNDGNPAHKRMVVFARNARKWKHGDGGPIDFSGITTTNSRPYNTDYISYIDTALRNGGMNDMQRAAVLANIIEESGGNPFAEGPGGYYGLLQWSGERYPKTKETDVYKEIDNQVANILATAGNSTDKMSWTHGGNGSGYNSLKDAMAAYNGDVLDDVMKGYTLGYVRPAGGIDSYNNRLKVAKQIYDLEGFRPLSAGGLIEKYGADKIRNLLNQMKRP